MFSRISIRPVAFTGPTIHNFGDQSSPQNLIGTTDLSTKDEFRHDISKVVQNATQPPTIQDLPDLSPHKREKPHAMNSPAMSYTGGWANPMNPNLGGAPIPHADMGLESPSFQNRRVSQNQTQQLHFRGSDQRQVRPAFMATIADYPSLKLPEQIDHVNFHHSEIAAKAKLQAIKTHPKSKWPFSMNLPYGNL
jgi:hypothetical protein